MYAKRLEKIEKIMPVFWSYVEEGDEIELGLVGDPLFPEEYKHERPHGMVTHVQSCSDDSLTMQVKTKDQSSKCHPIPWIQNTFWGVYD